MNSVHNSQERRSIRVKDFLDDFYSGMADEELQSKYALTPTALEKFFGMLVERGILDIEEIRFRYAEEEIPEEPQGSEAETSAFICPACLTSHKTMFDICPKCGVSFQDLISQEKGDSERLNDYDADDLFVPEPHNLKAAEFSDSFAAPAQAGPPELTETTDVQPEDPAKSFLHDAEVDEFGPCKNLQGMQSDFDDALDDVTRGEPLEEYFDSKPSEVAVSAGVKCESCEGTMEPALRDIYDRRRSRLALMLSGICLAVGFLGSAGVSMFDGYSFGRLIVVYFTGVSLLFGGVLSAVGAFTYLAREKVYYCDQCKRIFPRG